MNKCIDCALWSQGARSNGKPGWGECSMGRSCAGEPLLETLAYGVDGDEYSATMLTRNDFGCVQFTTRQKPPIKGPVFVPP